jgi:hypothetical protein
MDINFKLKCPKKKRRNIKEEGISKGQFGGAPREPEPERVSELNVHPLKSFSQRKRQKVRQHGEDSSVK